MTKGDSAAWLVARRALDHREAVKVLTDVLSTGTGEGPYEPAAEELAAGLARHGLVLVRMDVDQARDFFSRKEDT